MVIKRGPLTTEASRASLYGATGSRRCRGLWGLALGPYLNEPPSSPPVTSFSAENVSFLSGNTSQKCRARKLKMGLKAPSASDVQGYVLRWCQRRFGIIQIFFGNPKGPTGPVASLTPASSVVKSFQPNCSIDYQFS